MKRDHRAEEKLVSAGAKNQRSGSKSTPKLPPMISDSIPVGVASSSIQGKYLDANEEFCRIVGYEKEQLVAMDIQDIVFEEDYPFVRILYQKLADGKIPFYQLEKRYVRKDGTIIWVEAKRSLVRNSRGKALGIISAILDVTEQKRSQERLREQLEDRVREQTAALQAANQALRQEISERTKAEDLLRSWAHVFEHAEWGIATVLRDMFVMVNPVFAKMHGYEAGDLVGGSIYDVLAPESHADMREQIRITCETGHHVFESKHIRKDGSTFPALVDTSVVRDSQGNVLYRAVSIRDITARKQTEKALEESRQYLQALSRRLVEVQEEERRSIARELHDRVGQNLSALNLNLTMMKDQVSPESKPDLDARLQDSLHLVTETTKLVRDLLRELRPAILDDAGLPAALEAYIDEYTRRYTIKVVLEVANEPFPRLNPGLEITLLRIAQEALTNIARHARADQALLSLRLENNAISLTILDNGIGIEASQSKRNHISQGLKIMCERAEAFGGTVGIGPAEEKGTKVSVSIPVTGTPTVS